MIRNEPQAHPCPAALPAVPHQSAVPDAETLPPAVRDLRGRPALPPPTFPAGDRVVVSGLPGSGKSTLIRALLHHLGGTALSADSQDVRERWDRRMPHWLPYALYRPAVRMDHYRRLRRALAGGAGVVVHDCGNLPWVRRWLARDARRRGVRLHLVVLDVPVDVALAGQAERGRTVSPFAFARHRRATARLLTDLAAGRLPAACDTALLVDRAYTRALRGTAPGASGR
ncbi:AAA family ATPase [Streptomyces chumphonensis]|uniref:AAA family ATPase n=1 Tax=Streptomyces chumphonensis TaxID=1214925 RepID=UPI003D72EB94